ncbi:MAG: glucuronate isomerase [Cytophagales bacterium]|nr:glucuronate isomerase [Bernardetiaceae bacterium]MDW8204697.1 glucuronate isomerase [Cytophagales bacterium]
MKKNPITDADFLLDTAAARELYHQYAARMPIVDYHNHLNPALIANNHRFESIAQLWLAGDHYKWRALRTLGVSEKYLSGEASDYEKFQIWCKNLPFLIGNPLYHWSHIELARYFDLHMPISEKTANEIYRIVSEKLQTEHYTTHGIFSRFNLRVCCTTDDPTDSLEYHAQTQQKRLPFLLLPSFRPDNALIYKNHQSFRQYMERLATAAASNIQNLDDVKSALAKRIDYFDAMGCRTADHGLLYLPTAPEETQLNSAEKIFQKMMSGKPVSQQEKDAYLYDLLLFLCEQYAQKGWVQQFHLGAKRNNNERAFQQLGADTGYDSIGAYAQVNALNDFLNTLDKKDALAKTIIYNLNPKESAAFAATCGNFHREGIKGFVQWGAPWWFLDQKHHIEEYFNILAHIGVMSVSIGMLTDSRSFMSLPRHEYYRRLLCRTLGRWIEEGLVANDMDTNGEIVCNICYYNVCRFFNFPVQP